MKKILYTLSVLLTLTLFSSCNSLDLSPEDYYGSSNFWTKESQVSGFLNGLHSNLRGSYNMFYILGECRGGTSKTGTSSLATSINYSSPIKSNTLSASSTGVSSWDGLYSRIMQVNLFIQNLENGCTFLTDAQRSSYLAPAYGLRALYYFMLYRTYGGVPLITTVKLLDGQISADALYTARSTAEETMTQIKSDIDKSESLYGTNLTPSMNSWSGYATLMLKGEIYLWSAKVTTGDHTATGTADLQTAKTALQTVVSSGKYSLNSKFSSIFTDKSSSNKEVIFSMFFKDKEATNLGGYFLYADAGFVGTKYSRDGTVMTDVLDLRSTGLMRHEYKEALWRSYDETDTRRDATFLDYYDNAAHKNFGCLMLKYIGSISNSVRVYDSNVIVYRYSDALLMLAEIENSLGGDPSSYINQVRQRAYGSAWGDAYKFSSSDFATNEMAILHERDKEFVGEGKRWFDVVRMKDAAGKSLAFSADANYAMTYGDAPAALLTDAEAYMLLWPVDTGVLNGDDLVKQTPGY